jgi:hypothetical protein
MGKKKFKVTEDLVRNANDYIPLSRKLAIAKVIAPKCIEKSKTAEQNQKGLEFLALPTLWVDDLETKSLYTMSVLLTEYLKVDLPEDFTDAIYDEYASTHILNQLERFKSVLSLKDKVFDLLNDFRDFKKLLDTEIFNEKEVRNDPVARMSAAISIVSNPESIKKMQSELEKTVSDYEIAQKEAREKLEAGKVDEE